LSGTYDPTLTILAVLGATRRCTAGAEELEELVASLPKPSDLAGFRLYPIDFEKVGQRPQGGAGDSREGRSLTVLEARS